MRRGGKEEMRRGGEGERRIGGEGEGVEEERRRGPRGGEEERS